MSDGISEVYRDNEIVDADKKAYEAKKNFEENISILNADSLLTRLGKMRYMSRGYWKSIDVPKINREIEEYQNFIYYETD